MGTWTISKGSIDLLDADYIWAAGTGDQSIDVAGYTDGTIVQSVPTRPGKTYRLRFQIAANVDKISCLNPDKTLIVRFGEREVVQLTVSYDGRDFQNMNWTWMEFQ